MKKKTQNIEFTENEELEIVNRVIEDYDADLLSRADWEADRERYFKLWACQRDPKSSPWPGASNVCIPMLASAANQFHARAYQSIMAAPGLVRTIPVGPSDVQRAENVEKFLNWQLLYDMPEYEDVFDRTLQLLPINGTAIKKLNWNKDTEAPESHFIPVLDFIVPYNTRSLKTAIRKTHRLFYHREEIEDRFDSGFYSGNLDTSTPTSDPSIMKQASDELTGLSAARSEDKPFTVLEQHRSWKIDGKKRKVIFWVIEDTRQLVRSVIREYSLPGKPKPITLEYFIDYHFIPNPEGWYSLGWGHFLEVLNEMANTTFNQIFDSGRLSNQPFGFYTRRSGFKSRKLKLTPGAMYEVEDASGVFFPSMQRVDNTLFMVLGQIQSFAEQFTSATELLSGRQQKGVKTPTATGTMAVIEQGLVTFAVLLKRVLRSLRDELRLLSLLNQLHMPNKKQYRVMEDPNNIAFPEFKKEDFEGVYDVMSTGDPSFSSRQMKRAEAVELYQLLIQNPLIGQNPDAIYELTSDILDTYGKKNKSRLLPPKPAALEPPIVENAKIAQGDSSISAKPGENHEEHLEIHEAFKVSPLFKSLHKDYKEVLDKHIQETQAVMMMEVEQQQQLAGQQEQMQEQEQLAGPELPEQPETLSPGGLL